MTMKHKLLQENLPFHNYSRSALDQAAFEQFEYAHHLIQRELEKQPKTTITSEICGHHYWLLDGVLVCAPYVLQGPEQLLPREAADECFTLEAVDGPGAYEFFEFSKAALVWLENPSFIKQPDDHYMGGDTDRPEKWEPSREDSRSEKRPAQPYRMHMIHGDIPVVVRENCVVRIGDQDVDMDLSQSQNALLAGAGYVNHFVMYVPLLESFGRPTCFDVLDKPSLLTHLAEIGGYSPLMLGDLHTATYEVRAGEDFEMEFHFAIRPEFVEALKKLD